MPRATRLRIDYIPSASIVPVITVKASDSLNRARTLMELHSFSQLPVMRGNRPIGVVSWESIGRALLKNPHAELAECIDTPVEKKKLDGDLLASIASINAKGYVLVVNDDGSISGIITSADLGEALADIAGPYLLLSEIEELLRAIVQRLVDGRHVTEGDVQRALQDSAKGYGGDPASLTLGDLANVFATDGAWKALDTKYDRSTLNRALGEVTQLRNKIMHFRTLEGSDRDIVRRLPFVRDVLGNLSDEFRPEATNQT
ncbi:CBS domain-containing protein [Agromyces fucosus]|uniref:CBS domain-containing protein n=1 Tax=Agromyces fucosus TaxID=41985 RepID=A0A4Q2JLH6_9MICO|nr:CBS domain-containing protein [Agromyces fucosus]RXZ47566.1 CBS domain-containing protein [Agromyces fucosus]